MWNEGREKENASTVESWCEGVRCGEAEERMRRRGRREGLPEHSIRSVCTNSQDHFCCWPSQVEE